ncbi:class F sortase [Actinoplanes sp. NPDC049548]|uniref:class F sortase n=1 Tax=Actinoplanes sp. NPDC049548 TaxID=3155152 RepID=UPI003418D984
MSPSLRTAALSCLALLLTAVLTGAPPHASRPDAAPVATSAAGTGPVVADSFRSVRTYPAVATPVRLRIRALGVDSKVQRLGLQPDGTVEVPERPDVAGWYEHGPRPGQAGPAVILGHVDSRSGPGIFARLGTVRRGTLVGVDRADGSTVTFRVTGISRVPKVEFPTDLVYAPSLDATLRLVTCGGSFDRTRGSYRDNVIVFADKV